MKRFRFRLQSVLDVRHHEEEVAKGALMAAQQALDQERATFQHLLIQQQRCYTAIREVRTAQIPAERELFSSAYRDRLGSRIAVQHGRVARAEQYADQARAALLAAIQKRKSLERLRERDYAAFQLDMRRKEQEVVDELASQAHTRQV